MPYSYSQKGDYCQIQYAFVVCIGLYTSLKRLDIIPRARGNSFLGVFPYYERLIKRIPLKGSRCKDSINKPRLAIFSIRYHSDLYAINIKSFMETNTFNCVRSLHNVRRKRHSLASSSISFSSSFLFCAFFSRLYYTSCV